MLSRCKAFLVILPLFASPLAAQESFEIAVYPYSTAERGEWELEGYATYINRSPAGTQGQVRFAGELTRGITNYWEASAYVLGAQIPDLGFKYAGYRLRSRFRAPESWALPVRVGLAVEFETTEPLFSESAHKFEVTPILEHRVGGVQLILNPTFERDISGAEHEVEIEPKGRAAFRLGTVVLGLEYYGTPEDNVHQIFPTADFKIADDLALHLGIGFGLTATGDRLVFKSRLEL